MSLIALPLEILQEKCRYLMNMDNGEENGVREFRSLVRSCRFLNAFITPYLYQKLNLDSKTMFLLLRSIQHNPALAFWIREANIIPMPPKPPGTPVKTFDFAEARTMLRNPDLLKQACTRYLHPKYHNKINLLLLEMLLLHIPNVEHLLINVSVFDRKAILFDERRWKSNQTLAARVLPNLKRCSVYTPKYFRESRDVIAQTRKLLSYCNPLWLWVEVPHLYMHHNLRWLRLPSVERLDIATKGMSRWVLEGLLQTCPNARSIDYYDGLTASEHVEVPVSIVKTGEVCDLILRSHQHVLESLKLHFYENMRDVKCFADTIPDLQPFSKLRELDLDSGALVNVQLKARQSRVPDSSIALDPDNVRFLDNFPSTLETLTIFAADDLFIKELESLADRKAHQFPNMKKLNLEHWHGDTIDSLASLRDDLSAVEIEFLWDDAFDRTSKQVTSTT